MGLIFCDFYVICSHMETPSFKLEQVPLVNINPITNTPYLNLLFKKQYAFTYLMLKLVI